MNFKVFFTLFILSIFLAVLSFNASAITASLGNPKMILYTNVTAEAPGIISRQVMINNANNFSVDITVEPDDVMKNLSMILFDEDKAFSLEPKTSRSVNFTIFIKSPGYYDGKLYVIFRGTPVETGIPEQVGLASSISVRAKGVDYLGDISKIISQYKKTGKIVNQSANNESKKNDGTGNGPSPIIGIAIISGIVICGLLAFLFLKKK